MNNTTFTFIDSPDDNDTYSSVEDDSCSLTSGIAPLSGPLLSAEIFRDRSRFWIQRILVPTLVPVGVLGNVATIAIMSRPRMRSSTSHYLAALAVFDMLYLTSIFVLSLYHYPGFSYKESYMRMYPFWLMFTDASSNTSVWLTVTFTVERYVAVCHPIRGKILCTESRAKKMIIFVLVTCFLITLPTFFEWRICDILDPRRNETLYLLKMSDLGSSSLYQHVYYWATVLLFTFLPLLILIIFNTFLIQSVRSSQSLRRTMTQQRKENGDAGSSQERKITIMLIAVVVLFLLCQTPTAVTLVYDTFRPEKDRREDAIYKGLNNIFNFLMNINAAGNFVLYSLLSQKYRRTFVQTFCPCLKGKMHRLRSVYQNTVYSSVPDSPQRTVKPISLQAMPSSWSKPTSSPT